jgi:hypothetical protein
MKIQKTVKAKIFDLTNRKEKLLNEEYNNWQQLIQSLNTNNPNCLDFYKDVNLYSATKQQCLRLIKRLGKRIKELMFCVLKTTFE